MSLPSQIITLMYKLPPATHKVETQKNILVRSEPDIDLMTDIALPAGKGPFPTILMRTPYGRFGFSFLAELYAERGYACVLQAVRGTDGSSGEFSPLVNERRDGLATVEWIKQQSWFNGQLAANGPSYLGYCAWAISDAVPEGGVISAKSTSTDFSKIAFPGGAFQMQLWLSWMQTIYGIQDDLIGMTLRVATGDIERRTKQIGATLPLKDADIEAAGKPVPFWRHWMEHAIDNGEFWEERNHTKRLTKETPPALFVTGWYDLMAEGSIDDYQTLVNQGQNPYLTIGPWHHTQNELQGESIVQTLGFLGEHIAQPPQKMREKPVRLFVTGHEQWQEFDQFPPADERQTLYLAAGQKLQSAKPNSGAQSFIYDPADPTPNIGGATFAFTGDSVADNRPLEARDDVLIFTSDPLEDHVSIIGQIFAKLSVTSSVPFADFFVRVTDVQEDGKSLNVCDGILRPSSQELSDPEHRVAKLTIKLGHCAHRFNKGHRLRVQISGGAHPRYAQNLGTDEPVATATKCVASTRTLYLGGQNVCAIDLPIYQGTIK